MKLLREYLEEHYNEDHLDNNIRLSINKIFPIEQTEYLVNKVLPSIKELKYRGQIYGEKTSRIQGSAKTNCI